MAGHAAQRTDGTSGSNAAPSGAVEHHLHVLRAACPDQLTAAECAATLSAVRAVRGWLDAFEAQVIAAGNRLNRAAEVAAALAAERDRECEFGTERHERPLAPVVALHDGQRASAREIEQRHRRAELIAAAPAFGDALAAGEIGTEHVDRIAAAVDRLSSPAVRDDVLADTDALLADATTASPDSFARRLAERVRQAEARHGIERDEQRRRDTYLARRTDLATGMTIGSFALHPELAAKIFGRVDREVAAMIRAGETAGDPQFARRQVNRNRLAAEALGRLVHHDDGASQRPAAVVGEQPTVADISVIIDIATLATGELHDDSICETRSGVPIPVSLVQRLACDGYLTGIVVDEHSNPLYAGRTSRHATPAQRRALAQQYRTCGIGPNCDVEFDRCEIHHIIEWHHDGPTDITELIPACSRHHHQLHAEGWGLHLAPDRTLTITDRSGNLISRTPPPNRRPRAG